MPATYNIARRAASNMSQSKAASALLGCIQDSPSSEDFVPAKWVPQPFLFHNVYVVPKHVNQFLPKIHEVPKAPPALGTKLHQHIHIAVGPEILTQHRAKQRKLNDLPFAAEFRDPLRINRDVDAAGLFHSMKCIGFTVVWGIGQ